MQNIDVSSVDLLHPELLPTETLLQILLERKVKVAGLTTMAREKLIEIFLQYCLPYAQRKSRRPAFNNNVQHKNNDSRFGSLSQFTKTINIENDQIECDTHSSKRLKLDEADVKEDCNDSLNTSSKRKMPCSFGTNDLLDVPSKKQKMHVALP